MTLYPPTQRIAHLNWTFLISTNDKKNIRNSFGHPYNIAYRISRFVTFHQPVENAGDLQYQKILLLVLTMTSVSKLITNNVIDLRRKSIVGN